MELSSSHYIAFTAFVQLAVALNFGLVYLDRRSGLIQLKRKLFRTYRASNNVVVQEAANTLKRYRRNRSYSDEIEHAHTKAKQYHTIVTSDWDDEHELSFLPTLGVIYGFYGLAVLYLVGFFEVTPDKVLFYENEFLVMSQVTLLFSIFLILRSKNKTKITRIVPACILYFVVVALGWWFCSKGWIFECDMVFPKHYHWYMLLVYLPIIYYIIRVFWIFLHKTICLFGPLLWWTFMLKTGLDEIKK